MKSQVVVNPGWQCGKGLRCVAVFVALAIPVIGCSQEAAQDDEILRTELNKPWPAPVTPTSELPPPDEARAPAEAMDTITMPPGYQLELVAAEPLVRDPILAEFDGDGRLWVLEMHGFAYHEDMQNTLQPLNDLVILEDTDNDSVFDKRTVFMNELVLPRAFKILDNNCALVGAPPNLFHACDTDGDLQADTRDIIRDDFDEEGVLEHGANGLYWGMDNTIFVSQWTWSLKLGEDGFHTIPNVDRGQWGVTQDSAGRIYRNVNSNPLHVDYVAAHYYARNPDLIRTTGLYQNLINQDEAQIWPARPTPGLNRAYRAQALREDGSASYYGGVSSPMIYRGDRLPEDIREQPLVVDSPTNLVHLLELMDNGSGNLYADDYYDQGEIIASTDERFRPVQLVNGWDGSFYVIDMYRGVSQDYPYQTDYLRTYINENNLWEHTGLGRVYRVVHSDADLQSEKPSMSDDTPLELVEHLSHPNGWWRDTAQQLLVQRADEEAIPALEELVHESDNQYARLHALWTLSGLTDMGLDALDAETVRAALEDDWWGVRTAGIRVSESWLREGNEDMSDAVIAMMEDDHWQVRRQLAASLGELPEEQRMQALVDLLNLYGDQDAVVVDAALSGLAGLEEEFLALWLDQENAHADVAGMLVGAIAKSMDVATVEQLIATATDPEHPDAVRAAMLHGLALGLEGEDGDSGGGAVAGGRAGSRPPGMRPDRPPVIQMDIESEPTMLTTLVEESEGQLADAAAYAEAVLGWPGKPRDEGRARTEAEEELFQIGEELYATVCASCHGTEGTGTAVGISLVGSPYVNADPEVFAAIMLQGKEGDMGLMPPQLTMDDEQLAAVMTYVRGSFGNTADPINEIAVGEFRQLFSHRSTPWSEQELDDL